VTVVPPGAGSSIAATVVSTVANGPTDPWGDAQSFTITYQIVPPGGAWTTAGNGTYKVNLGGSAIQDLAGHAVAAGTLGNFQVQTGQITITKYRLLPSPISSAATGTIVITNSGPTALPGPIFVVFNLPAGTVLENATGTYNGLPYIEISFTSLGPGSGLPVTVTFSKNIDPSSYSTAYYLGSLGS
jgi:hypothetical protein